MNITKYEHACLVIEEQGQRLVIDPGNYSKSLPANLDNVVAIVITHVHADHFDPKRVADLFEHNSSADIFCTEEVSKQLKNKKAHPVTGGQQVSSGPFKLRFFGGQHAPIHDSWPVAQNVGVLVNNKLYYPGDSFSQPSSKVTILALPVSAPWLKVAEAMDFLTALSPKLAFPTHNSLLSEIGESMVEHMLGGVAQSYGGQLKPLAVSESLQI